jgi:hypothetical protein
MGETWVRSRSSEVILALYVLIEKLYISTGQRKFCVVDIDKAERTKLLENLKLCNVDAGTFTLIYGNDLQSYFNQ